MQKLPEHVAAAAAGVVALVLSAHPGKARAMYARHLRAGSWVRASATPRSRR